MCQDSPDLLITLSQFEKGVSFQELKLMRQIRSVPDNEISLKHITLDTYDDDPHDHHEHGTSNRKQHRNHGQFDSTPTGEEVDFTSDSSPDKQFVQRD